jgi:hypothetical protein
MRYAPIFSTCSKHKKKETGCEKAWHHAGKWKRDFQRRKLSIGLDLGDRSSSNCILDEAGEVLLEHKLATTPEAMKRVFGGMPHSRSRAGDRSTFTMGQPAVNRVRPRSDRRLSGSSTFRNEYAQVAPSENRSPKSADGRMATEAARRKRKKLIQGKTKPLLTLAGLLMEGLGVVRL